MKFYRIEISDLDDETMSDITVFTSERKAVRHARAARREDDADDEGPGIHIDARIYEIACPASSKIVAALLEGQRFAKRVDDLEWRTQAMIAEDKATDERLSGRRDAQAHP